MKTINPITAKIIETIEDKDTIRKIAKKTGFAYSAVYYWINQLYKLGVLKLERKGNKTLIITQHNEIYINFKNLIEKIAEYEKDKRFWAFIKNTKLKIRLGKETSAVIWTKGSYITGDFYNKIYYIDVTKQDFKSLSKELKKYNINFSINKTSITTKPFVIISIKNFKRERTQNLPLTPLKEVISWCRKLKLEPILEQLSIIYKIPIKEKYSEVSTNV